MRCNGCGKKLDGGVTVCPVCGRKAPAPAPVRPVTPPPAPYTPPPAPHTPPPAPNTPPAQLAKGAAIGAKTAAAAAAVKNGASMAVGAVSKKTRLSEKTVAVAAGVILAVIVIVCVVLANSNKTKIIGKWEITEVEYGSGTSQVPGADEECLFEFKKDGTLQITENGEAVSVFYKVDGNVVILSYTTQDPSLHLTKDRTERLGIEKLTLTKLILVSAKNGDSGRIIMKKKL